MEPYMCVYWELDWLDEVVIALQKNRILVSWYLLSTLRGSAEEKYTRKEIHKTARNSQLILGSFWSFFFA